MCNWQRVLLCFIQMATYRWPTLLAWWTLGPWLFGVCSNAVHITVAKCLNIDTRMGKNTCLLWELLTKIEVKRDTKCLNGLLGERRTPDPPLNPDLRPLGIYLLWKACCIVVCSYLKPKLMDLSCCVLLPDTKGFPVCLDELWQAETKHLYTVW